MSHYRQFDEDANKLITKNLESLKLLTLQA